MREHTPIIFEKLPLDCLEEVIIQSTCEQRVAWGRGRQRGHRIRVISSGRGLHSHIYSLHAHEGRITKGGEGNTNQYVCLGPG